MAIYVVKEGMSGESRVSLTPDVVKRLVKQTPVFVESGAGEAAGFSDVIYKDAGATVVKSSKEAKNIIFVTSVSLPGDVTYWGDFSSETTFIGTFGVLGGDRSLLDTAWKKQSAYSLDLIPRISRAQSMDVLSSQANMGGYRAVLEAISLYGRSFPMMMTAAGTVPPAKVLVLGAGVAGLQAIATAKRLGAVVSAFDVRPAVKEQVQSLGASFVEVDADSSDSESSGYAKEMSEDYKNRQAAKIAESVAKSDIVITTALIPGRKAPRLITKDMVKSMKAGGVIVDMAAGFGGNCELSKPNEVVLTEGVQIVGYTNLPSRLSQSCSLLYAKNLYNFLQLMWDESTKTFTNDEDEIVQAARVVHQGTVVYGKEAK